LAWACGSTSSDFGIDDLVDAKLHLELGGTGSGTVTSKTDELEYEDEFNKSCTRASSPCEWASDLDEFGVTTLTLTAEPDGGVPGSTFTGWAGQCAAVSGTPEKATVVMNAEVVYDCIAEFTLKPAPTCTVRFGETDWITPAWDIVVVSSDGAATQSISLANTGGNPSGPTFGGLENPSFRQMLHTMDLPAGTSGTSRITVAQFPQDGRYNPTASVVQFIYREDQIISSNPDGLPVTWGMAVRQYDIVRLAPLGTFNTSTWQRKEVTVLPADFGPAFDPSQGFDVGFYRSTTTAANPAAGSTVEHGIDNWQIETCQ
jgi:hypothetical protein